MCRLLLVQAATPFDPASYLAPFADACHRSREYQGHGWGLVSVSGAKTPRHTYKNIRPIWEDDLAQFGPTSVLLVHARSAFRDEDIVLPNNMPFVGDGWSFAFNGELRGVRVRVEGRTGAARIWRLIQRAHYGSGLSMRDAVARTVAMLERRSEYLRAVNIVVTDGTRAVLHSTFNESPDYFTLHQHVSDDRSLVVTSSERFDVPGRTLAANDTAAEWRPVPNHSTLSW